MAGATHQVNGSANFDNSLALISRAAAAGRIASIMAEDAELKLPPKSKLHS